MNQVLSLFRLQQIDTQLDHHQARLTSIQKILEDDEVLRGANERVETAEKEQHGAERELHQIETTVQDLRIKIEQNEASLYGGGIHSPKELQDLQNDVAALKRYQVVLEDQQLEKMLALEQAENGLKSAQQEYQSVRSLWTEKNQHLTQEMAKLQKEVERLSPERQAIAVAIPVGDLGLYDSIRHKRRGVAVASVADNACTACGAWLTPAQVQNARLVNAIAYCPSCGRILYTG